MWRMWEDRERFVSSASPEFTIPESPRDVFEARAVLKRFLTFCKDHPEACYGIGAVEIDEGVCG
jgi:hypothetical protein